MNASHVENAQSKQRRMLNPLSDKDVSRDQSEMMDFQADPGKEHDVVTESLN